MRDVVLNGRFLDRPVTGVERVAAELSRAIRQARRDEGASDLIVLTPQGRRLTDQECPAPLGNPPPAEVAIGPGRGHLWEQAALARACPGAWLLDLCNTGPVFRRRQALLVHDAQFISHPDSYSRAFRYWYRAALTIASRRCAALFTVSAYSRSQLEHFGVFPPDKAHVLRLGVDHLDRVEADPSILNRLGLEGGRYLLAIGSLARHKNLALLIDAFVAADMGPIRLVIAGGGNPRVFGDAGLRPSEQVQYAGRVTDAELQALYRHALAFACPSLSEGFGFPPLEAMAAGCPVVATTGGAVPETCGGAALYADPTSLAAWRDALRRIVEDEPLRSDLALRGRARAGEFRWRSAAHQLLGTLAAIDAGAGRAA